MIKLLTLNTNRNQPCARQRAFLRSSAPDVLCLQEVREDALEDLKAMGFDGSFAPIWREDICGSHVRIGASLLTKIPNSRIRTIYFRGDPDAIPDFDGGATAQHAIPRAVQILDLPDSMAHLSILNVHFTWSRGGQPSDLQRSDLKALLRIISQHGDLVLCGDFNAPYDGEIFRTLRSHLTLAMPPGIRTTIDGRYHYAKGLEIMVDGFLFRGNVQLSPVSAKFGVSDHCALSTVVTSMLE